MNFNPYFQPTFVTYIMTHKIGFLAIFSFLYANSHKAICAWSTLFENWLCLVIDESPKVNKHHFDPYTLQLFSITCGLYCYITNLQGSLIHSKFVRNLLFHRFVLFKHECHIIFKHESYMHGFRVYTT
jgi:hypothetical protein